MSDFFLGGILDPSSGERTGDHLTYEPHHLTTHGVIVGMTGSGKTGLGIVALEEALHQGIPTIVIDPKGDMGNLLLVFPELRADDFAPWIDPGEASRSGRSMEQAAQATADLWKDGLEGWGIDPGRLIELRDRVDATIYTPGSTSGTPLNVIGSLAPPDLDWDVHAETLRDEIEGFVSSLLVLAGIEADPITSPAHILLATIIEMAWREGHTLDLATLIGQVQAPPLRKLGVFELDTFFPPKERTKLAMRLNGLVASPSFSSWMEGPPLDIDRLLFDEDDKPNAAVINIAHLSDQERQFVVTLLMSKVVTWMRKQQGSSDLRALIYMDEVFGFAPPTAEPPSKKPILTLLKQARAYGVGLLLSTQNPVDLDYKAMSNAGTWLIGRLQTERDKARILEGLRSASGGVDIAVLDTMISGLGKRQFILHSTRSSAPVLFTTRWAMSYLAGPLSREQIAALTPAADRAPSKPTGEGAATAPTVSGDTTPVMPTVDEALPVAWMDPAATWASVVGADPLATEWNAGLAVRVRLRFDERHADLDHTVEWEAIWAPLTDRFDPSAGISVDHDDRDFSTDPPNGAVYRLPHADLSTTAWVRAAERDIKDWLTRNRTISLFKNPELKLHSRVGETREGFSARCADDATNRADAEMATLKDRFSTRIESVQGQLRTAELRVRDLTSDLESRRQQEILSGAGDLLSGLLGGRRRSPSLKGIASRRTQTKSAQDRLATAETKYTDKALSLEQLEDDLATEILSLASEWDARAGRIETVEVGLEKDDVTIDEVRVVWIPMSAGPSSSRSMA